MIAHLLPWELLAPERRLFHAHRRGDSVARALFGRGADAGALAAAVEERRRAPLPHRAELAAAVEAHLRVHGAPGAALAAARRLADERTVVVVAGQQPAPLGGPLLSWAKALHALALARLLEAETGGPAVAIWWVASEDHDRAEAGAVHLGDGRRGRDVLGGEDGDRRMLCRVPARAPGAVGVAPSGGGEFVRAWVDAFGLPEGARERWFEPPEGVSVAEETVRLFLRLLGPAGLVVVEPRVIHPFAREVFERDVRRPGEWAALVRRGNEGIRAAGFDPVLADPEGSLHFRVDGEGRRTRGGGTEGDLADIGGRLSADVSLRVLAQDAALPVAVQVAGPAEAEYLAALGPAHGDAGIFRPAVAARPGVTILEARTEAALASFGAGVGDLYGRGAGALPEGGAATVDGEPPLAALAEAQASALSAAAGDPAALNAAVRRRLAAVLRAQEEFSGSVRRAAAERRDAGDRARRRVLDALLPDGVPQERRLVLPPFLLRHGPALLRSLEGACAILPAAHVVVRAASTEEGLP